MSLQSRVHFADGVRLASFIAALAADGAEVAFSPGPLSSLGDADVLAIPTRSLVAVGSGAAATPGRPYGDDELDSIESFVRSGRGLLLMTNHGDVPGRAPDHTSEDARLAKRFGITIERSCFVRADGPAELAVVVGPGHPVLDGVVSVKTMTTASLLSSDAATLVPLDPSMIERLGRSEPQGRAFALATERGGRVVVMGNSGFIGSPGTPLPNRGLFAEADNARFVLNAVRWLARRSG